MPIYEYTCQSCSNKFEQLVRTMNGDASAKCPECGSTRTARSLSVFAVGAEGGRSKSSAGAAGDVPTCGRCGGPPGSCRM